MWVVQEQSKNQQGVANSLQLIGDSTAESNIVIQISIPEDFINMHSHFEWYLIFFLLEGLWKMGLEFLITKKILVQFVRQCSVDWLPKAELWKIVILGLNLVKSLFTFLKKISYVLIPWYCLYVWLLPFVECFAFISRIKWSPNCP